MSAKIIKLQDNDNNTLIPVTDASVIQIAVDGRVKSVKDVILENEKVVAASHNALNDRIAELENASYITALVEVSTTGDVTQALESNKFYKFINPVDELTLTLVAPTGYGDVMGIYAGKFTASSTWDSIVVPASVEEAAGNDTIAAGKTYEFNILDNVIMVKEI